MLPQFMTCGNAPLSAPASDIIICMFLFSLLNEHFSYYERLNTNGLAHYGQSVVCTGIYFAAI